MLFAIERTVRYREKYVQKKIRNKIINQYICVLLLLLFVCVIITRVKFSFELLPNELLQHHCIANDHLQLVEQLEPQSNKPHDRQLDILEYSNSECENKDCLSD